AHRAAPRREPRSQGHRSIPRPERDFARACCTVVKSAGARTRTRGLPNHGCSTQPQRSDPSSCVLLSWRCRLTDASPRRRSPWRFPLAASVPERSVDLNLRVRMLGEGVGATKAFFEKLRRSFASIATSRSPRAWTQIVSTCFHEFFSEGRLGCHARRKEEL